MKKNNRPFKLKYVAVGEETIVKEMHPAVKNYSMTVGQCAKVSSEALSKNISILGKINNALAERASSFCRVKYVNINTHTFCISSNFIILPLLKSKYIIILNNGLSAACGEML